MLAVLAGKELGAERIIAISPHDLCPDRSSGARRPRLVAAHRPRVTSSVTLMGLAWLAIATVASPAAQALLGWSNRIYLGWSPR